MHRAATVVLAASLLASLAAATPIKVSFVATKPAPPAPAPHAIVAAPRGGATSFATTARHAPAPAPAPLRAKSVVAAKSAAPAPAPLKGVAAAPAPAALAAKTVPLPALPAVGALPALPALALGRKMLQAADPDDDQTTLTDVLLLPEPAKAPPTTTAAPAPPPQPSRAEARRARSAGLAKVVGSAIVNAVAPVDASAPAPPPAEVPEVTDAQRAAVRGLGVTTAPVIIVPGASVPRGIDTPGEEGFVLPSEAEQAGADAEARVAAGGSAAAPAPAPPKRTVKLPALPASTNLGLPALPPVAVGVDPAAMPKPPARRDGAPVDEGVASVDGVDAGAAAAVAP